MLDSTIKNNKAFLYACKTEIQASRFVVTVLVNDYKVSSSLFYSAVRLGFFERIRTKKHAYKYNPKFTELTDEDVILITKFTYGQVSEAKEKGKITDKVSDYPRVRKPPLIVKDSLEIKKPPLILKEPIKIMPSLEVEKLHSHLQDETDEDLISELKRRGYEGTITIKKQVTL